MSKELIMTPKENRFKMYCNYLVPSLYFDVIDIREVSSYPETKSDTETFFSYSLATQISLFPTQIILFTVNESQRSGKLMIDLLI